MISVIIPYYLGDGVVKRALNSCAAGKEIGVQIILAFDSPEDGASLDIKQWVKGRAGRELPEIVMMQNEVNLGPAATRRAALTQADREFVILCDQDDELTPARFDPSTIAGHDLILFEALRIEEGGEVREHHPPALKRVDMLRFPVWNQWLATRRQPARMGAVTMRRNLADRALSANDGGGEEWEFFVTALSGKPSVKYDPRIGIRRHVHGENLSVVKKQERLAVWQDRVGRLELPNIIQAEALKTIRNRAGEGQ